MWETQRGKQVTGKGERRGAKKEEMGYRWQIRDRKSGKERSRREGKEGGGEWPNGRKEEEEEGKREEGRG